MSVEENDDLRQLVRVVFVVGGLGIFVAWSLYEGVGTFLDL